MRYLLGTVAIIALLAAAAAYVGYCMSWNPALHAAVAKGDTMEWLRTDFHLADAQLAAIRQLHASYAGTCEEHCRMIQEATRARNALEAAHDNQAAIDAANGEIQRMRRVCEQAIESHVRRVAALMSPEDGRRYLGLVLPKIANFDHTAAPDLRLNTSS
jgi:Heavy-metal resistance